MTEPKHTPCGIYRITNTSTGQHYIGSSLNIRKRWNRHREQLRQGEHHSLKLQRAWNKYGEQQFEFSVLETVLDKQALLLAEQWWLDTLQAAASGYNILSVAGSNLGRPMSEAQKEKIRAIRTGSKASAAARESMSKAGKARMARPEEKARISTVHKGRKRSAETCANITAGKLGKVVSDSARANMSAAQKARAPATAETRAKISAANTGGKRTPEQRARMAEAQRALAARKRAAISCTGPAPAPE